MCVTTEKDTQTDRHRDRHHLPSMNKALSLIPNTMEGRREGESGEGGKERQGGERRGEG